MSTEHSSVAYATGPEAYKGALPLTARVPRATVQHMQRRLGSSSVLQLSGQRHPDTIWGLEVQFLITPQLHTLSFGKSSMSLLLAGHSRCLFSTAQTRNRRNSLIPGPRKFCLGGWLSVASHHILWWWLMEGGNPNTEK